MQVPGPLPLRAARAGVILPLHLELLRPPGWAAPQGPVTQSSERSPVEAPSSRDTEPDHGGTWGPFDWISDPSQSSPPHFQHPFQSADSLHVPCFLGLPPGNSPRGSHMSGPGAAGMPSLQKAGRGFRLHLMKPRVKEADLRPAALEGPHPAK